MSHCGGREVGGVVTQTVVAYDPRTNKWTKKASLPAPFWGRAVRVGDKIHALKFFSPRHYIYDVAADAWTERTTPPLRGGRFGVAMARDGRILVLEDNSLNSSLNVVDPLATVEAYDPLPVHGQRFRRCKSPPQLRCHDGAGRTSVCRWTELRRGFRFRDECMVDFGSVVCNNGVLFVRSRRGRQDLYRGCKRAVSHV